MVTTHNHSEGFHDLLDLLLGSAGVPAFGGVGLNTPEKFKQWDQEDVSKLKTTCFAVQSALKTKKISRANILIESRKRCESSKYKQTTKKAGQFYSKYGQDWKDYKRGAVNNQTNVYEARTKRNRSDRWENQ